MKPIIPEAALQQHIAVLGKTRSGKSSVMRGLVEGLLEKERPVCIVDPKGDWWGIKLARDGKKPGYPVVIFGGEHADVPINEHAGAHVAELFATGNRSMLIDLGGWMVGERTRFYIDFASTLFKLTKGMRYLVIDEIHNFAPKGKVMDPAAGKALHWTNRLASEGLGKGLPMLFASQRPQKVHNDTLTSAETLIAMRVLHPSDRGAVADWIKGCGDMELGNRVLNSLAQMDRGEGWAWSPEIGFGPERVKFPMFKTYDSFRAQTAEDVKGLKGWAEVDLEEVKSKLAVVVQEAEANDPRKLKAEIQRLTKELRDLATAPKLEHITQEHLKQAEVQGRMAGRDDVLNIIHPAHQLIATLRTKVGRLQDEIREVAATVGNLEDVMRKGPKPVGPVTERSAPQAYAKRMPSGIQTARSTAYVGGSGNSEVGKSGLRRMLIALAQRPSGLTRQQLGVRAGMSSRSGTFDTYLSRARSSGWIDGGPDRIRITGDGAKALGSYEPLPEGRELLAYWLGELGQSGAARILRALAAAHPDDMSREQLGAAADLSHRSGTFDTYLSRLRSLELVTGSGNALRASEELFG